MTILSFLIGSLAVFRLSTMISQEKGPGFIFCKMRNATKKGSALSAGLSCPLCVSVYVSAFISSLYYFSNQIGGVDFIPVWLALSGGSVCLTMAFTKDL